MPSPFLRTLRALRAERSPAAGLCLGLAFLVLVSWGWWLKTSTLPLWVVSDEARLEIHEAVHPVTATDGGKLRAVRVEVGQDVEADEVLFELDAELQKRQLTEEQVRREAIRGELARLAVALDAEHRGLFEARNAADAAVLEARLRHEAESNAADLAADEARRSARLHASGLLAEMDLRRSEAEAEQRRAQAAALEQAVRRLASEKERDSNDRQARIDQLESETAELRGRIATSTAASQRLAEEIRRRSLRAPVAGRVGELARVRPGAAIAPGDHLATVIGTARLGVVAAFSPGEALARLRPGQKGELRLDAFPWIRYGGLRVEVTRVAQETREGQLWIDARLEAAGRDVLIPLEHGLPGTLTIEVERLSPAEVVLRALGRRMADSFPARRETP